MRRASPDGDGLARHALHEAGQAGVLICGHGSRRKAALDGFASLAAKVARRLPESEVTHAFLELAKPSFTDGLNTLRARGVKRIVVVPCMLANAGHVKRDIPAALDAYLAGCSQTAITCTPAVDSHPALLDAARDHVIDVLRDAWPDTGPGDAGLVIVGRGTSDPATNARVGEIAEKLRMSLGFRRAGSCFAGTAPPGLIEGIGGVARWGLGRIVVLPWLLFDGVLAERTRACVACIASADPRVQFALAPPIGSHDALADILFDQVENAV